MRVIRLVLLMTVSALLLACFTSCSEKQSIANNDVKFDTLSIAKYHHLNNDSTLPSCNLSVALLYPVEFKDKTVLSNIQSFFVSAMFDDAYLGVPVGRVLENYSGDYIKSYTEDAKRYLNEKLYNEADPKDKYFSYYEDLSNSIFFNKANLMSVQFIQSSKKGNKATFKHYSNYVLDLKTGKGINEVDIFNEGYEKVLNVVFRDKLLETNHLKNINELEDLGFFGIEEIMPNNNFLADDKGLTYIFNKGEYSVLQLDEIRIFIAYEEILHILREESQLSLFYEK